MLKHIEVTGKNPDEAIAKALAQLGMDRDDVSVEILELGKTGFLGIGSVPAKVRVSYEGPDEPEKEPEPIPAPAPPKPVAPPPKPARPARPAPVGRDAHIAPSPKPAKSPVGRDGLAFGSVGAGRSPQETSAHIAPPSKVPAPPSKPAAPTAEGEDEAAEQIRAFMTGLFAHMGLEAVPEISRRDDIYEVVIQGENLGSLIGRRGETLDAIQQLTGYAVNKGRSRRVRIHVDAEHYRARREESLRRLAHKVAGKVVRYRRSVTLEAMNAYERHVIHAALQDYRGVSTYSTGVEPNRRVVVAYDPEKG